MATAPVAYTIGYEGRELDEFVARLREQQIEVLIDIREKPASRKSGFPKPRFEKPWRKPGLSMFMSRSLAAQAKSATNTRTAEVETPSLEPTAPI